MFREDSEEADWYRSREQGESKSVASMAPYPRGLVSGKRATDIDDTVLFTRVNDETARKYLS